MDAVHACGECHAEQVKQWQTSDHFHANATATEATALGNFDNQVLEDRGFKIRFTHKKNKLFISMPDTQGKMSEYLVEHTFGYFPLQQYTFATTPGNFQFFPYAWDLRAKADGGQRWFNLYETMQPHDEFHWSQMGQNWNQMCVECHVTDYKKAFDAATGNYEPQFSADNVSCDACHGNSDAHLQWAAGDQKSADKGYAAYIGAQTPLFWRGENGLLQSIAELRPSEQINSCASCHSRRSAFKNRAHPEDFFDQYQPVLLTDLYLVDGQIWDEDYVWGSFVQSKKFQAGVTCTNCHNPHTGKTNLSDNTLCTQCHGAEPYDQKAHLGHEVGTEGSACVDCHMPATVYMAVDARRDHSFQIPRPDLTLKTGVPNACNRCHEDKTPEWAEAEIVKWHPQPKYQGQPHFSETFLAADKGVAGVDAELTQIAQDSNRSAMIRATALDRLTRTPGKNAVVAITRAVRDNNPLLRQAAIKAAAPYAPEDRWRMLNSLLDDARLPIRSEAARSLTGLLVLDPSPLTEADKVRLKKGLEEYRQVQNYQADRGFALANLGNLAQDLGDIQGAEQAYRAAIKTEPIYMRAYVNLAELYRRRGNEQQAQQVLKQALAVDPNANAVNYALGMSLVRLNKKSEALKYIQQAATSGEPGADTIYAYALLLQDAGEHAEALRQLLKVYALTPDNPDISYSLTQTYMAGEDYENALFYARKLAQLVPHNAQIEQMVQQLEALSKRES